MSRGTSLNISSGTRTFDKLTGGVFRQRPMLKAMSWSRDELLVGQNLKQPTALRLLDIDRLIELIRQKETVLDQDIRDAFSEGFASRAHRKC